MKKTLVALTVAAFASSASALTIYENEGSKIDFEGSVRLLLEKNNTKYKTDNDFFEHDANTPEGKKERAEKTNKRAHSNLHNDGTRFDIKLKHTINDDLYAVGRLRFAFDGDKADIKGDRFGSLYANRAYVGLGSKQFGEVTFGRQATIADDILQSGFDNQYHNFSGLMTTSGASVVRYDYKGVKGLQVGVDYRFSEKRDDNGEVEKGQLKSGYGVGAVYTFDVAEGQALTLAAGYTRDNKVTGTSKKHHKDAWGAGAKYAFGAVTVAADYVGAFEKKADDSKVRQNGLRVGAEFQVTPAVAVYTNYGYGVGKTKAGGETTEKTSLHSYILGSSYQLHKNVFTYVEGGLNKGTTTRYDGETSAKSKQTDKNVGVGLRVSW